MNRRLYVLIGLSAILLSSCSSLIGIEKRKYRKGYHLDVVHHRFSKKQTGIQVSGIKPLFPATDTCALQPVEKSTATRESDGINDKPGNMRRADAQEKIAIKKAGDHPATILSFSPVKNKTHFARTKKKNGPALDTGGVVLLILLTILVSLVLVAGLVGLGFALAFGVSEVLAVVLPCIGLAGVILADIFIIRKILGKRKTAPAPDRVVAPPDPDDIREGNLSLALSLAGLLVLLLAAGLSVTGVSTVLLILSLISIIAGFVFGRRVKIRHKRGEKYPGKTGAMFGFITGLIVMSIVGAGLLIYLYRVLTGKI